MAESTTKTLYVGLNAELDTLYGREFQSIYFP